ncbi:hypothetical protein E6H32_02345 [Candidatus Bathyarchaeota archaeon]|nr:MAG: hypothetical protein E6H32_02345 [Candidatus Bathyarchaeota archaeon]
MARNEQTGYIFAKCKGERAHIISQIQRLPNVESCTPVTGRFDLVIKLRTNEPTKAFTHKYSDNHILREHHQQLQPSRQRRPTGVRSLEG